MTLKYFGSKAWFKKSLHEILPVHTEVLVSPFFGSGKAEYYVAKQRPRMKVVGSDSFPNLVNFHNRVADGSIFDALRGYVGVEVDRTLYQRLLENGASPADDAAQFFMTMRNSYCGKYGRYYKNTAVTSGGLQLLRSRTTAVNVELLDAKEAIKRAPENSVIYVDPPYLLERPNDTYYAGEKMGDIDFQKDLAEALLNRGLPFILHTSDNPDIPEL
jgi:site-specific DNA-adenine methylase